MRRTLAAAVLALSLSSAVAACGDDDDAGSTADETTTTVDATTTTTVDAATTTALTAFPPDNPDASHGGTTWAVVLAGSRDIDDPDLAAAVQAAEAAGYATGPTDCDMGAPEAVGLDEEQGAVYTVSVYYATEAEAQQALTAFRERGWEGGAAAEVQTYCLD